MNANEKFWKWVMGIKPKHVVWTCVVVFVVAFWMEVLPYPPGVFVSWHHPTYLVNHKGIFYSNPPYAMLFFPFTGNAHCGYLKDADFWSFEVLDDEWARDKRHVWYENYPVKGADAATFQLGKGGIPKDKYHVFVADLWHYSPSRCGIDPATAEYFVRQPICFDYSIRKPRLEWIQNWMRDSRHVYFYERCVDVDRATFRWLAGNGWFSEQGEWYVDKNFLYTPLYTANYNPHHDSRPPFELVRVDSLREPLEVIPYFISERDKLDTLYHASRYLRNGRNILYTNLSVCKVVCNLDVKSIHFEKGDDINDEYICVINDTLRLQYGERKAGE